MADEFTRAKLQWLDQVAADLSISDLGFRAVYILASKYLNRERNEAWPSFQRLADDLGVTPRGVQKALRRVESAGHLEIITGSGRGHTNRFRPTAKKGNSGSPFEPRKGERRFRYSDREKENCGSQETGMAVPERMNGGTQKARTAVHPNPFEEPFEESSEHEPSASAEDFQAHARPLHAR